MDVVFYIYAYLRQKYESCLVLDPTYPIIDENSFKKCDWKDFYGDVIKAALDDALQTRGNKVDL